MQSIRLSWIAITLTLYLTPLSLQATESAAPWYEFEVIIFERLDSGAGSTELWPEDPGTPSRLDTLPMSLESSATKSGRSGSALYRTLPSSAWRLTELEQRLRRSRNFRPQIHLAWRQQMVDPDQAQPLYLEMMDRPDARNPVEGLPKIEGTLKVGIKRYLHFETDLLIRRLRQERPSYNPSGMLRLQPMIETFRFQTIQRMRSGKLYYLDHPIIGLLVLASKYEPPKPARTQQPQSPPATQQADESTSGSDPTLSEPGQ